MIHALILFTTFALEPLISPSQLSYGFTDIVFDKIKNFMCPCIRTSFYFTSLRPIVSEILGQAAKLKLRVWIPHLFCLLSSSSIESNKLLQLPDWSPNTFSLSKYSLTGTWNGLRLTANRKISQGLYPLTPSGGLQRPYFQSWMSLATRPLGATLVLLTTLT